MRWFAWFLCTVILVACGGGGGGTPGSAVMPAYSLGGSISGLGSAPGLILTSGTESLPVSPNASTFTFSTKLAQSSGYNVAVASQPAGLNCSVFGGAGTVQASNVDTVAVRCTAALLSYSLFAGNLGSSGAIDATGPAASFANPQSTAIDSTGNVYVADRGNHTIRKISPAGVVSTLAGTAGAQGWDDGVGAAARFDNPTAVAVDSTGTVFVTDTRNSTIRKITPAGVVSTFAGKAGIFGAGVGTTDGGGADARFSGPEAIAVDKVGNLYVADTGNHSVRKITPAGAVSTLAGKGNEFGSADGAGSLARFAAPRGIAVDADGNVYVADRGNQTIRKVTPAGVVSTVAGSIGTSGSADGAGIAAIFNNPTGIVTDSGGNLYIADTGNHTIRKMTPAGVVSTLTGAVGVDGSVDGVGGMARFFNPNGIAIDAVGNIYVADAGNNVIRKVTPVGNVSTLAGTALSQGSADGVGAAAGFNNPRGIATDSLGNVYVSDFGNRTVRKKGVST